MTQMLKKALWWAGLLGLLGGVLVMTPKRPVANAQVAVAGLAGDYLVTGTNSAGKGYNGTAKILQRGQAVYITWAIGQAMYAGLGLVRDGQVFASYGDGASVPTVAIYKIQGHQLIGEWLDSDGQLYPETLTKGGVGAGGVAQLPAGAGGIIRLKVESVELSQDPTADRIIILPAELDR